jgi:hypothetical protein
MDSREQHCVYIRFVSMCVTTQLRARVRHIASLASVRPALSCELLGLLCVQEAPKCVWVPVDFACFISHLLWLLHAVAALRSFRAGSSCQL